MDGCASLGYVDDIGSARLGNVDDVVGMAVPGYWQPARSSKQRVKVQVSRRKVQHRRYAELEYLARTTEEGDAKNTQARLGLDTFDT